MCGRATLTTPTLEEVAETFDATFEPADAAAYRPRYNLPPGDPHWMIVAQDDVAGRGRAVVRAQWGLLRPPRSVVMARAETARRRFDEAGFCALPVDGFFEWSGPRTDRRPVWFHRADRAPFLIGALYEGTGTGLPRFLVLTRDADAIVSKVHDRMPVLLDPARVDAWLGGREHDPLVVSAAPAAVPLIASLVSARVNRIGNDDPDCLAPAAPPVQGELF
jgi:putative SOS response-associated peptidase YedK